MNTSFAVAMDDATVLSIGENTMSHFLARLCAAGWISLALVIAASSTLYPFSLAYAYSSSTTDTELVSLELYSAPIVLYPGVASSASSMI